MAVRTGVRITALAIALATALAAGYAAGAQDAPKAQPTLKVGEVLRVGDRIVTCDDLIARIYESELGNPDGPRVVVPALIYLRGVALLDLEAQRTGLVISAEEADECTGQQIENMQAALKRQGQGVLQWKDWLKQYWGMTEEQFEAYVRERAPVVLRRRLLVNHFLQNVESLDLYHILVSRQGDADAVHSQLMKEDPARRADLFETLAVQKSEDRTSNLNKGRVGRVYRDAWMLEPATAEAAIWALKDLDVTKPVQSRYGWHVFMRRQTFTPKVRTLAEMRTELLKAPDVDASTFAVWEKYVGSTQKYALEQRVPGLDCKPNQTKRTK